MNTESLMNAVKSFLNSRYMPAYETWIEGCVEYFKEINNVKEIPQIALEQWLLHDLGEICPGCLPANLGSLPKTVLNGQYVLQINKAMDISVPAYQQYLKIKKADTENITATMKPEEKISSKRMLKLEMTDGKQTIAGIEYETINKLVADIVPGCKILIKGPVQCRHGMLLLTDKAVELLGGEVSDIAESHSLAAQLASKLDLPLPLPPATIESIALTAADSTSTTPSNIQRTDETNRQVHKVHQQPLQQQPQQQQRHLQQQKITNQNPVTSTSSTEIHDICDEDFDDFAQESSGKRQLETGNGSEKSEKRMRVESAVINLSNEYPDDEDELMLEDEEHLREIESLMEKEFRKSLEDTGPIRLAPEPFMYIRQINELSDVEKGGKLFRVKAQILTVLTKLTITDEWKLKCRLTDGTGCMDVEFASDILSGFLGFTPQDISELKKKIASNPDIKNEVNMAYKRTTKTLETLYSIMELTMYTLPKITRLIDFEESHVDQLKRRLNASGL